MKLQDVCVLRTDPLPRSCIDMCTYGLKSPEYCVPKGGGAITLTH